MSSSIGSTFSSGVQDVSAILPLMGTDQCENHITSGLEHGFLYPAATTLSIFGSLGAAKAGLMIAIASGRIRVDNAWMNFQINGAAILKNAGFGAAGGNGLSSILFNKSGTLYRVEEQLEKLNLRFEDLEQHKVKALASTHTWNFWMIVSSASLSVLGIVPYIHLNLRGNSSHSLLTKWLFPSSRILGSFLVAVGGQFVLQHRILSIVRRKLIVEAKLKPAAHAPGLSEDLRKALNSRKNTDRYLQDLLKCLKSGAPSEASEEWPLLSYAALEKALSDAEERPLTSVLFWGVFLFHLPLALVLIGSCLIVAGYVGCFSIVQGTQDASAPLVWLGLEIFLSILRMFLWASNPSADEKTGIFVSLKTVKYPLLPTCPDYAERLEEEKVFPITNQEDFFSVHLTPYLGPTSILREPPRYNQSSFFYTFTRHSSSDTRHRLYITMSFKDSDGCDLVILFHKDDQYPGTTFVREGSFANGQTEVVVRNILDNSTDGRILRNVALLDKLVEHYDSILAALRKREGGLKEMRGDLILGWTMEPPHDDSTASSPISERDWRQSQSSDKMAMSFMTKAIFGRKGRDIEMGGLDYIVSPVDKEMLDSQEVEVEDAEKAYLAFGQAQRHRHHCIAQMSRWIDHYTGRLVGTKQEESSIELLRQLGGSAEHGRSLLKWVEELERRFATESVEIERGLQVEYGRIVERLLRNVKDRGFRGRLKKHLVANRRRWVSERLERERKASMTRMTTASKWINRPSSSQVMLKLSEGGTTERVERIWEKLASEEFEPNPTGPEFVKRLRRGLSERHPQRQATRDNLFLPFGDTVVDHLNDPQSRQWEQLFVPHDIAFLTLPTDFKMYVVNNETLHFSPDLVLKRNKNLQCVFFDVDLRDNPFADAVVRSCFQSIHTQRRLITSIGFGEYGLKGASRDTINLFTSLVKKPYSKIHSVWSAGGSELGFNDDDIQQHLRQRLSRREEGVPRKETIIVYRGGRVSFSPGSFDVPSVPCIGGTSCTFSAFFCPPRGTIIAARVSIQLRIRRFEQFPTSTIQIQSNGNKREEHVVHLDDRWTTLIYPINQYRPDDTNTLAITISTALIASIEIEFAADGIDVNDRIVGSFSRALSILQR